jgi:hypothetical protein
MRINKSRQHNASAEVQFFCAGRFWKSLDFCMRSNSRDQSIAHQQRAFFDDPQISKRRAAPRPAAA